MHGTVLSTAFLLFCSFTIVSVCLTSLLDTAEVAAPSQDESVALELKMKSAWFGGSQQDCTAAFSCGSNGHLEKLYTQCESKDGKWTELHRYDDNMLFKKRGNATKWTETKGVPESKETNPLFPLGFCTVVNGNKALVKGSPSGREDWHADKDITVLGEMYKCTVSVVYPRADEQRPHHTEDPLVTGDCHVMPLDVTMLCDGGNKTIHNYMYGCTDKFNRTIFEIPSDVEIMDFSTEPSQTETADGGGMSSVYYITIGVFIGALILLLVTAVVLHYHCGRWRLTREAPRSRTEQNGRTENGTSNVDTEEDYQLMETSIAIE